jgi:exodeoxyribonuclease VII large subunit
VSGFKRHGSGHQYFALKDEEAVLDAICWKGVAEKLRFALHDGLEVIASGRITTYPGRSKYQLVVTHLEPAGEGALMALLEKRRKQLAAEGLFDSERKKPLPFMPKIIGVVTSPTGAVIRDILHRIEARFPSRLLLWPVAVQGEGAAAQVAAAIAGFNALPLGLRPDVLIVARGGGSLEDLWAFNEEVVVRAAAASDIPLISAIGHETDTTLIDFASDIRAPTPTAAAEMAVPVREDWLLTLEEWDQRNIRAITQALRHRQMQVQMLTRGLTHPKQMLMLSKQRLEDMGVRLPVALRSLIRGHTRRLAGLPLRPQMLLRDITRHQEGLAEKELRLRRALTQITSARATALQIASERLEAMSYTRTLARGFILLRDGEGKHIATSAKAREGSVVTMEFADGSRSAVMGNRAAPRKTARVGEGQGSLL